MAIEIVDWTIEKYWKLWIFPEQTVSLPEGNIR